MPTAQTDPEAMTTSPRCSVLDLDLSESAFVDSTGLGVLVRAQQRLRSRGGELRPGTASTPVARVLDITGFARALPQALVRS